MYIASLPPAKQRVVRVGVAPERSTTVNTVMSMPVEAFFGCT